MHGCILIILLVQSLILVPMIFRIVYIPTFHEMIFANSSFKEAASIILEQIH